MLKIHSLNFSDAEFYARLDDALAWEAAIDGEVAKIVADIAMALEVDEGVVESLEKATKPVLKLLRAALTAEDPTAV